jgi:MraZ protein
MSTDSIEPIYYNSLYRHGVDEKRRIQIPAKWRPAEPEFQFTIILWQPKGADRESCLLVLGPEAWRALVEKVKAMSYSDSEVQTLRRNLGKNSDRVTLDKAGRICLPETMAKAAGVEKEAVLVGLLDRFEIWGVQQYAAASALDDRLLPDAMKLI